MDMSLEKVFTLRDDIYKWLSSITNTKIVLISCTALMTCHYVVRQLHTKHPPGPWCLPFLGNVSIFTDNDYIYKSCDKLYKDYGELCYLKVGPYPLVLISGQKMIRRMLVDNKDKFSDRSNFTPIDLYTGGGKGLIKTNYVDNKVHRKFAMQSLRNYGLGKSFFEEKIQQEANTLVTELLSYEGQIFDPKSALGKAVSNIIFMLVINKRYEYDDASFIKIIKEIDTLAEKYGLGYRTFSFLPVWILRSISDTFTKCMTSYDSINDHIKNEIKCHENNFDPENIQDFIDIFIKISKETNDIKQIENLHEIIFDLIAAGVETTSSVLRFLIFYLCKFPRVQVKCREEIYEVMGRTKQPALEHKSKLVYNVAMTHELLRLSVIVPAAIAHVCSKDITLDGYNYKKNTTFIPNIYSCHMNEETFPEPFEFKPERWIDDEGEIITPPLDYMPFSVGPRSCMGDILAKTEIFIFSTTLIQRLHFAYDGLLPNEDIQMGITRKIRQNLKIKATQNL